MRRRTTTRQIADAISNNLLSIQKAECSYKTSRETETIDADRFRENIEFLCESGCFVNCIGWHYERNYITGNYIIETGYMDPNSENAITVYLNVNEGISIEDIDKALLFIEED